MRDEKEKVRLLNMLNQGVITEGEYGLLIEALSKKKNSSSILELILNPFKELYGFLALFCGIAMVFLMAFLGDKAGIRFTGLLSLTTKEVNILGAEPLFIKLGWMEHTFRMCLDLFIFALVGFLYAKMKRAKNIRLIDFVSMTFFAKLPFFLLTIMIFASSFLEFDVTNYSQLSEVWQKFIFLLYIIGVLILAVYQFYMLFAALRESSGLKNLPLFVSYFIALFVVEITSRIY